MKPLECKQRDLLNFNRQLEYHQLQQREIKTFKRKNAPRSAVEDRRIDSQGDPSQFAS